MSTSRTLVAIVAIFAFALLWNGLVHLVILKEANQALLELARPAAERSTVLSLLLALGLAAVFVLSFNRWASTGNLAEGARHGLFFAILAGLLVDLNQYLVYPLPATLPALWFAFGLLEFIGYGLIVAALYPSTAGSGPAQERMDAR